MLSNIKIRFDKGVIRKYISIKFANKSSLKYRKGHFCRFFGSIDLQGNAHVMKALMLFHVKK